jgi:hypothetical protein
MLSKEYIPSDPIQQQLVYTLDKSLTAPSLGRRYVTPFAASTSTKLLICPCLARQKTTGTHCIVFLPSLCIC